VLLGVGISVFISVYPVIELPADIYYITKVPVELKLRDLLATVQQVSREEPLLSHVESFEVTFYDGQDWQTSWLVSGTATTLPQAIRVRLKQTAASERLPAPLPLAMGQTPERVVDETAPVKLLAPADPLLSWPNKISTADFDGWYEERGHSFLDSWDPGYNVLTETADPGQDPQRGGLIVTHPGKGTYIYVAYALHLQTPELIPGAYRLLANLLSAGHDAARQK